MINYKMILNKTYSHIQSFLRFNVVKFNFSEFFQNSGK